MNKKKLFCVWPSPTERGCLIWIDDKFLGNPNYSLDEKDLHICAENIKNEKINLIRPTDDGDKWQVIQLGAECKSLGVTFYVGHFDALDSMTETEISGIPEKTLFFIDCHNKTNGEDSIKDNIYGIDLVARKLKWGSHAVRFYSRYPDSLPEISTYVCDIFSLTRRSFDGFFSILVAPGSVRKPVEAIRSFFGDSRSWFVLPPGGVPWFIHGKAHNRNQEFFDAHCASVRLNFPPADDWEWKWDSAKALFEVTRGEERGSLSPHAIIALGLFPKLVIHQSLSCLPHIESPAQPAFPFFWSVHEVFAVVNHGWAKHGEPNDIPKPSGEATLRKISENPVQYFIGIKYKGANEVLTGIQKGKGDVTEAVAKAVYGFSNAPSIPEGYEVMLKALRGSKTPVAMPVVHKGWFGFRWPLTQEEQQNLMRIYRKPNI